MTTTVELAEGTMAVPRSDAPLRITDFVRYQGASGDMNPIHHDVEYAKRAGYDTVFAVGMLAAGRMGIFVTDWLGAENVRTFGVRFKEQAWPGDILTYTGTVLRVYEEQGEKRVDVELECRRQTGGAHLVAWATAVVPA